MNVDTNKHQERFAPCQCTENIWLYAQVFFSCFIRQLVLYSSANDKVLLNLSDFSSHAYITLCLPNSLNHY